MKKHITNKFDKKLMPSLPRAVFKGKIVVVLNESEAEKAVDYLLSQDILGLDTETRPSFVKGCQHKVALLQVATHDICFLFRLNILKKSPAVKRFLEDKTTKKIGLSWHDDIRSLSKRFNFEPGTFIDLQNEVKSIGIADLSLAKIFANLFQHRISKREQLSNWEADILQDKQKLYAATDAWACIMIYEELMHLKETGDYELEIVPEEEHHTQSEKHVQGPITEEIQEETTHTNV